MAKKVPAKKAPAKKVESHPLAPVKKGVVLPTVEAWEKVHDLADQLDTICEEQDESDRDADGNLDGWWKGVEEIAKDMRLLADQQKGKS